MKRKPGVLFSMRFPRPGTLLWVGLLTPVFLASAGIVPVARFERERIEITVHPRSIAVDGLYIYRNPLPLPWSQGLSVPFAVNDTQMPPATVGATMLDPATGAELRELTVRWIFGVPRLEVPLPAGGDAHVRIRFSQRATGGTATYLLTTTAPWGRPLERGDYLLHAEGVRIFASNYALEGTTGGSFVRERFMPERDWTFRWSAK
jgi:hypothetical protein